MAAVREERKTVTSIEYCGAPTYIEKHASEEELEELMRSVPHTKEGFVKSFVYHFFHHIVETFNIRRVLEIGFNTGASARMWCRAMERVHGSGAFISIDLGKEDGYEAGVQSLRDMFGDTISLRFYAGDSRILRRTIPDDIVPDIVFIDGSHEYSTIVNDFLLSMDHNPRMILFDDLNSSHVLTFVEIMHGLNAFQKMGFFAGTDTFQELVFRPTSGVWCIPRFANPKSVGSTVSIPRGVPLYLPLSD